MNSDEAIDASNPTGVIWGVYAFIFVLICISIAFCCFGQRYFSNEGQRFERSDQSYRQRLRRRQEIAANKIDSTSRKKKILTSFSRHKVEMVVKESDKVVTTSNCNCDDDGSEVIPCNTQIDISTDGDKSRDIETPVLTSEEECYNKTEISNHRGDSSAEPRLIEIVPLEFKGGHGTFPTRDANDKETCKVNDKDSECKRSETFDSIIVSTDDENEEGNRKLKLGDGRTVSNYCAICLSSYNVGDKVVWSSNPNCPHAFHCECIVDWWINMRPQEKQPCAICRAEFIDQFELEKYSQERKIKWTGTYAMNVQSITI